MNHSPRKRPRTVVATSIAALLLATGTAAATLGADSEPSALQAVPTASATPASQPALTPLESLQAGTQSQNSSAPGAEPTPTSDPTGQSTGSPAAGSREPTEGDRAATEASDALETYFTLQSEGSGHATNAAEGLVSDSALSALQARAEQYEHEGMTQIGEPVIVEYDITHVDLDADPPVMTVAVCLDLSNIDVLDASGRSQADRLYQPGRPVLDIYTFQWTGSTWAVHSHELPSDDRCDS